MGYKSPPPPPKKKLDDNLECLKHVSKSCQCYCMEYDSDFSSLIPFIFIFLCHFEISFHVHYGVIRVKIRAAEGDGGSTEDIG